MVNGDLQEEKLKCFDLSNGNFKDGFNPYHNRKHKFYDILFDCDGNLSIYTDDCLKEYLIWNEEIDWKWDCDFYKMLHADDFISNTNGNYSAIYYWR